MENVSITWGQRVHICNYFPKVGTLREMHISRVMRGILVDNASAQELSQNGIVLNELGIYEIPTKNENRPSSISVDDEALDMFHEFIENMSAKRLVPLNFETVFTEIETLWEEHHDNAEQEEPEPTEL